MLQKQINEKYQQIHEFIDLLKKTDYHVYKHVDPSASVINAQGVVIPYDIPSSITAARLHARSEINRLEAEIEQLETELEEMVQITDEIEL